MLSVRVGAVITECLLADQKSHVLTVRAVHSAASAALLCRSTARSQGSGECGCEVTMKGPVGGLGFSAEGPMKVCGRGLREIFGTLCECS